MQAPARGCVILPVPVCSSQCCHNCCQPGRMLTLLWFTTRSVSSDHTCTQASLCISSSLALLMTCCSAVPNPAPHATLKLGQQLRKQEFRLHSPNPRMLPREFVPERLDVDCSLKTPLKAPEEAAPAGRGGSKRGRGGMRMPEFASTAVIAPHALL